MIGEFAFQLIGARWSGIRLLSGAIAANSKCSLQSDGPFGGFLTGKTASNAEKEADKETRTRLRVDNFQRACWHKAGATPSRKWGHQTMVEDIGGLLDEAGTQRPAIDNGWVPERGKFNAIDYFICRCVRVPAIFLLRDGRASIPTKIKNEKVTTAAAVAHWKFSVHVMKRVAHFTQKYDVIRLEDLLRDPCGTLRSVSDLLGVPFSEAMIKNFLPGDSNAALRQQIDPQVLATQTEGERWVKDITGELEDCGYLE